MPKTSSPPPKLRGPRAPISEDSVPNMQIFGSAPGDFLPITSTTSTLYCALGLVDRKQVLAPYIQLRFLKPENIDIETPEDLIEVAAFSGTLAFENGAFMIMDLARDFRSVSRRLVTISSGSVKPEPVRLAYALECLASARDAIDDAIAQLKPLAAAGESVAQVPAKRPARPVVTKRAPSA